MGIGVTAHTTLDTEQLTSHSRTGLVDTTISIQDSDGGVIPIQEIPKLLPKIRDILDNVVSKWVGVTAHILPSFLIPLLGSFMKYELHSTPFFTILRILFLTNQYPAYRP